MSNLQLLYLPTTLVLRLTAHTGWEKLPSTLRSHLSNSTRSELATFPADWPEIELLTVDASTLPVNDTGNYITISTALDTFTSRGNVTINSTDTNNNPVVNPAWLSTTADQELAIQAFKRLRQVANATGITTGEFSPGPAVQTDAQILEFIGTVLSPLHHAAATCKSYPFFSLFLSRKGFVVNNE